VNPAYNSGHLTDLQEQVDDEDRIELVCSNCGERLYFDADILNDEETVEVVCPTCNEIVYVNDGSFDFEPAYIGDEYDYDEEENTTQH
jgi:DNA-directed RNA polymerase subunit RPC12/RpoP